MGVPPPSIGTASNHLFARNTHEPKETITVYKFIQVPRRARKSICRATDPRSHRIAVPSDSESEGTKECTCVCEITLHSNIS